MQSESNEELARQNLILQEQVKQLIQQLQERDITESKVNESRLNQTRNDQSSFFSAFRRDQMNQSRIIHKDSTKKDIAELSTTIKRLNDEKETLRLSLRNQTEAFNQKLAQRDEEIVQKDKLIRQLQNEYKELQNEVETLKKKTETHDSGEMILTPQYQFQHKVTKLGLMNLSCQLIIRKNLQDANILEVETVQDKYTILMHDIFDLKLIKDDQFSITYRIGTQQKSDTYETKEARNICRQLKSLLQSQQPVRRQDQPGGGLMKSLTSFFKK